ncbi:hypothetical protein AALA13_05735 [Lachnospiraceae bacterium 50-23]
MKDNKTKAMVEGISLVVCMVKVIVQHRGQARKGKADVSSNRE